MNYILVKSSLQERIAGEAMYSVREAQDTGIADIDESSIRLYSQINQEDAYTYLPSYIE